MSVSSEVGYSICSVTVEQCRLQPSYVSTTLSHAMPLSLCTVAIDDEICNTIIKCPLTHSDQSDSSVYISYILYSMNYGGG